MKTVSVYGDVTKDLWIKSAMVSKQLDNGLGAVHGIGLAEYMVLMNLANAPKQTLRRIDIADSVARTASAITRMLMPMEKIGLVKKESSERDARVSLVRLTPAGAEVYQNASVTLESKAGNLLKNFSKKEANELLKLLKKI